MNISCAFFFVADDLPHHLVDPVDHVLWVAAQTGLHAGVVKELPDYHACVVLVLFAVFVETNYQVVALVEFKGQVAKIHPGFASLNRENITFACSYIMALMNSICLIALEVLETTKAGPKRARFDTTTFST